LLHRFFKRAANEIYRYEGTINQFMGDGFLALFGAPIAHEDHCRRAVLAALALRAAVESDTELAGVQLRQGINTGEVVIGSIGDDLRMEYSAFGDTIILAARLQAAADPDEILVAGSSAKLVGDFFELEDKEPIRVKESELHPVRVVREAARQSRLEGTDRRLAPFTGRTSDLSVLTSMRSRDGGGHILGIVGEPGIGKSRLVYEFLRTVDDAIVHEGKCLSFGAGTPYLPVIDLLRGTCGITASDSRAASASRLRDCLIEAGIETEAALCFLLHLLGEPDASAQLEGIDPSTIKGRTFETLRTLWLGLAEVAPRVVVFEDLHWIDQTSEEFLASFADELVGSPILLLTTYRPAYSPPWAGKSYAAQLALSPLSGEAGRELVRATADLPDELTDEIVARGEGNPLFLEELARAAVETGGKAAVPRTITDVLTARIDRLGEGSKRTIQGAAVLGREFTLRLLEAVLEDAPDVVSYLQELKRLELVYERRGAVDRTFVFKHALTQAVAYDSLLESPRRELHARAGRALEAAAGDELDELYELLAHHYSRSADREKAVEYLILANRKAGARNAMSEAITYLYSALATLDELPDTRANRIRRASLVFEQTGEFHFLHRHREYYDLLLQIEPIVRDLDDEFLWGSYLARLGHREWTVLADFHRAEATLKSAAEICERTGNDVDAASAYAILGWSYQQLGEYDQIEKCARAALEKLGRSYHSVWFTFAHAVSVLGCGLAGKWDEAKRRADVAISEGHARSDAAVASFNGAFAAFACLEQRDWQTAVAYSKRALEEAPTVYFEGFPQVFLASHLCSTGKVDQGLPVLEAVIPFLEMSEHRVAWEIVAPLLVEAYRAADRDEAARALAERVLEWAQRGPAAYAIARAHRLLGELDGVRGHFDKAIEIAERTRTENELALSLASRGRLCGGAEGRADLERALAIFERLGTCLEPDRIRGELAQDRY